MSKPRFTTQQMAAAGIIAAIYAALTLLLPIPQYGGIQFRVAEAMTVLPFLFPEAIPGLTVGCFLANLLGSPIPLDWIVGTAATLLAALWTSKLHHRALAPLPAGDLQYGAGRCGDRLVFHPGGCRLLARVRLQLPDRGDRRGRRLLHSGLPAAAGPAQSPRTEGPDSPFPDLMPLCAKKKSRVRWTRDFFST